MMSIETFNKLLLLGSDTQTADIEKKRNKILNFSCLILAIIVIFFTVLDSIQGILNVPIALNFITQIVLIPVILYFNALKKWQIARVLFISLSLLVFIIQNNILFQGFYGEYFYIIIPLLCMFFFDKKGSYFLALFLSLVLFYVPNFFLNIYPEKHFGYANVFFIFVGIFSIVYFFKVENTKNEQELKEIYKKLDLAFKELEKSKKNELAFSNLKALQSQMNPHFIFNVLTSLQDLVLDKDIKTSNKYLGKFSSLIRRVLLSSKEQFITLEEEIKIITLYLDLEKLRFGDELQIDLQCNVLEKEQNEILLPAMFIQPYIENAIKHGLFHKIGTKKLQVHFTLNNKVLECIIKDNGVGQQKAEEFNRKRLHLHTGFSTKAINERIDLLNGALAKKIELQKEDLFEDGQAVGTKITLHFPI